jgi:hypothetical protein
MQVLSLSLEIIKLNGGVIRMLMSGRVATLSRVSGL